MAKPQLYGLSHIAGEAIELMNIAGLFEVLLYTIAIAIAI